LSPPFGKGRGGPGGWYILIEPEVHFIRDREVAVPDLAGWRKARMPHVPDGHRFEIVPDWVCEILSAGTASKDREIKLPLYARHGVEYAWIIDPRRRTLEVLRRVQSAWEQLLEAGGSGSVTAPPFDAIAFELGDLWE
jgi:Uma2 family endonuclease